MDESERLNRRSVVSGLAIAIGWWMAGVNIRPACAEAVRSSKPPLTPSSMAAMMTGPQRARFNADLANSNDFVAFLSRYFTTTDSQARALGAMTHTQLVEIKTDYSLSGLFNISLPQTEQQKTLLNLWLGREGKIKDFWSNLGYPPSSSIPRRAPSIRPSLRIRPPASRSRRPPP